MLKTRVYCAVVKCTCRLTERERVSSGSDGLNKLAPTNFLC